ncbi:DUF4190 domain-containing protein [Myceligenerans salitolerans]|uniref:DUF4190 domain-containing protein n=1 Tax=Myceligenerans salitolerans TaxID=1230528 RepID=A0ABS3I6C9_9MICO|nr:DUF4190 domain-containing protein [Myceligenerans salitolerans]MBO0608560.1 DUF4190 domain-containing protein [Myceligenerans salitolerans]
MTHAPQPPEPYGQQAVAGAEDPGKTLGVVGLVLAILFPLIGLIVSIIARNKSKEAGFQNGLAKGGIIVSIVLMVLGIVAAVIGIVLAINVGTEAMEQVCGSLGPGEHVVDGVTYTCS